MDDRIHAIIRLIDEDALVHSDERFMQLKAETDHEIDRETAFFEEELEQRREAVLAGNKQELAHKLERYSRRLHREILTYRRELLDEMFDAAVRKLCAIPEEEYKHIFISAIKGLVGNFVVSVGERSHGKLTPATIESALKTNSRIGITVSRRGIPKKSGFVLSDGHIEYSYLFEDIIEDKKNEQSALILKEVFGLTT